MENAFSECNSIVNAVVPEGVTEMKNILSNCEGLVSLTLPDSLQSISSVVCSECPNLATVYIGKSAATINGDAFVDCRSITSYVVSSENPYYKSIDGIIYSIDGSILVIAPNLHSDNLTIPYGVTTIGDAVFNHCHGLISVSIPNSVTSIGNSFGFCSSLTSITIPNSVTYIGDYTFTGCYNLASINIPEGITTIRSNTFLNCESLDSVSIPKSVTTIEERAFAYCTNLKTIVISNSVRNIDDIAFDEVKHIIYHGSAKGSSWGALSLNGFVEDGFVGEARVSRFYCLQVSVFPEN
jgi:hypothetical protein